MARGLTGVWLIVSDGHAELRAARQSVFGGIPWRRCQPTLVIFEGSTFNKTRWLMRPGRVCPRRWLGTSGMSCRHRIAGLRKAT
ncbi:MAG: transposase [Anaerolineales bacterium]|nr:transposase [Anaerolineales bacterium]